MASATAHVSPSIVRLDLPPLPTRTDEVLSYLRQLDRQLRAGVSSINQAVQSPSTPTVQPSQNSYSVRFTISDWQGPDYEGYFYMTVVHNLNSYNIAIETWKESFDERLWWTAKLAKVEKTTANVLKLYVTEVPDERFGGRLVVLARTENTDGGGGGSFDPNMAVRLQLPLELPYAWNNSGTIRISFYASKDLNLWTGFQVLGGVSPIQVQDMSLYEYNGVFAYAGVLAGAYSANTLAVDDSGFVLAPANSDHFADIYEFGSVSRGELFQRKRLCVIGTEIMAIQLLERISTSPVRYRIKGVLRGLFDTSAKTHAKGASVFLWKEDDAPFVIAEQEGWSNGANLSVQSVPYTTSQEAAAGSMPVKTLALCDRAKRPMAVGSLLVDGKGAVHRPWYIEGTPVRVSWVPRNLVVGSTPSQVFASAPAVDAGLDFVVRVYDDAENLLSTHTVAAGTTFTDTLGVERHYQDITIGVGTLFSSVTVVVNSRQDGLESLDALDRQELVVRNRLAAPTGLTSGAVGSLTPTLTWDAVAGAGGYVVTIKEGETTKVVSGVLTSASYTVPPAVLETGHWYSFLVTARDVAVGTPGCEVDSEWSTFWDTDIVLDDTLADGTKNIAYTGQVAASGGVAPYGYAVTGGALPAGLTLASNGAVTGTPTTADTYTFTVTATDAKGRTGTREYSVTEAAPSKWYLDFSSSTWPSTKSPPDSPTRSIVLTGSVEFTNQGGQDGESDILLEPVTPPEWQWPNHLPGWWLLLRGTQKDPALVHIMRYPIGFNHGWRLRVADDWSSSGPSRDDGPCGTYTINGQTITVTDAPNAWDGS